MVVAQAAVLAMLAATAATAWVTATDWVAATDWVTAADLADVAYAATWVDGSVVRRFATCSAVPASEPIAWVPMAAWLVAGVTMH